MSVAKNNIKIEDIIEIARTAGDIAMQLYDKDYSIAEKENKTPVTEADLAIHEFLTEELHIYGYPILSEEDSHEYNLRKDAEHIWIIDPLDGTADFIQKTGEFSIMIGLVDSNGRSILGVVYAPESNELYFAQKNQGAFLLKDGEKTKIKVTNAELKNSRVLVSRNHLGDWEQEIAKKYDMKQISMGSAGLKICRIAVGEAELYINSSNKSGLWDICAADVILSQAGGKLTTTKGGNISYIQEDVMLQNGYIAINSKGALKNLIKER